MRFSFYKLLDWTLMITLSLFLSSTMLLAQSRDKDPVVVTGDQLSSFHSTLATALVGFSYTSSGWLQVPIQVDERVLRDISAAYGNSTACINNSTGTTPWNVLYYADSNTPIGADPNPNLDSDDELVFMQFDTGGKFTSGSCPTGVNSNSLHELAVIDPLSNTVLGYLYLFERDSNSNLVQDANQNYVTYQFMLDNGQPVSAYNICENDTNCNNPNGSNDQCESSIVSTSEYEIGYSARWIEDVLKIKTGNSTATDILDRHQGFIAPSTTIPFPGKCPRTEDTFSAGRGPIVNAIDGPIRAIRSVMGSNSGTFNQLTAKFTKYRVDYRLDFRVHNFPQAACAGFVDAFDFNANTIGMKYYSSNIPGGVTVDGNQDAFNHTTLASWNLLEGSLGAIAAAFTYETDMPITNSATICQVNDSNSGAVESYYDDGGNNALHTCTGDGKAYGSFGFRLFSDACTDRRYTGNGCNSTIYSFVQNRFHYYLAPGTSTNHAQTYSNFAKNPLQVNTQTLAGNCGGNTSPLSVSISSTNETNSQGNGSATANPNGGTMPYSYQWSASGGFSATSQTIQGLSSNTYFLTVTDADGMSVTDNVFIDNIVSGGCSYILIDEEDFTNNDWGIWNDGGTDSKIINAGPPNGQVVELKNGTNSSTTFTNTLDLSSYSSVRVSFVYGSQSMETDESFKLEISTNGGASFTTVKTWTSGTDFTSGVNTNDVVSYEGVLTNNVQLRFSNQGNQNNDRIYLDDIRIEACAPSQPLVNLQPNNTKIQYDFAHANLFPNPVHERLTLSFVTHTTRRRGTIRILNGFGQVMYSQKINIEKGRNNQMINVSALSAGLYWLQLTDENDKHLNLRFIK